MSIVLVILGVGLFFGIAILLAGGILFAQSRAKKKATEMLRAGKVDAKTVKQTLKTLSTTNDNEGKRLYNQLADLAEAPHTPSAVDGQSDSTPHPDTPIQAPPRAKDKVSQRIMAVIGVALVVGVALMIYVGATDGFSSTPQPAPSSTQQATSTSVMYEITGTASSVSVTLNNATGGTEQYGNARVPQQISYPDFQDYFLYISAQNNGGSGSVTVTIYVNGRVVKTATSSGAYVIATASDSLR